jgi:preprotein translocase subunit SecD
MGEAQTLALVLRTGSLDAPVVIAQVRSVGPSLGADSIRKGRTATIFGLGVVLVFMVGWYRTAGVMADIALTVNLLLVLALLALFGATLTLPGIAGIALTIGMAVDANIIIYERIREELKLGALPRKAVDTGFEKAMVAVLDANITTGIAGIVLFSYGTGPIKGFAVTLLIGIITTLVTALFVTRTLMGLLTRSSTARLKI